MTRIFIFSALISLLSCQEQQSARHTDDAINSSLNAAADTAAWEYLRNLTVLSFLDKVSTTKGKSNDFNFITIEDDRTSHDWITAKDIDTLISLIKSKKTCKCVVDPLSSYLPTKDSAELGGYAILFLKQYKEKKEIRFGLWACPKTSEKEADELIKWWESITH